MKGFILELRVFIDNYHSTTNISTNISPIPTGVGLLDSSY